MTTTTLAAGTDNFLVPNATIVVELVLFVIVFFIFKSFIVPPLVKAMREREDMVKKQAEDRAEAARVGLEQAKERYDSSLTEARAESTRIRDEARAEAEKIRQDMRAETDREVEAIKAEGAEQLAAQRLAAVRQLRGEIGGLSTSLAGRILNRPVGADGPHKATIEGFLAELDDRQPAGGKS